MTADSAKTAKPQNANVGAGAHAQRGAGQLLVDLGPVIVFVLSYNLLQRSVGEDAIYWATGLFMGATFLAIGYSWWRTRHIPPILIVTGFLVLIFGGLTIALKDRTFVMIKPIFVYLLYAGALFGGHLLGKNLFKMLMRHAFTLPDRIWTILSLRWASFFAFMALVSAALWMGVEVWRVISEDFWVQSRLFITYPLIIGFGLLNIPLLMKYIGRENETAPDAERAQS